MSNLMFGVLYALGCWSAYFAGFQLEREISGKNRTSVNVWWLFCLVLQIVLLTFLIVKWD